MVNLVKWLSSNLATTKTFEDKLFGAFWRVYSPAGGLC